MTGQVRSTGWLADEFISTQALGLCYNVSMAKPLTAADIAALEKVPPDAVLSVTTKRAPPLCMCPFHVHARRQKEEWAQEQESAEVQEEAREKDKG
jgi:hypothetical protein